MKTIVLKDFKREGVFSKASGYTSSEKIVIVNISYFYDDKDNNHKVVICYWD